MALQNTPTLPSLPALWTRAPCSTCRASGKLTVLEPYCRRCRTYWRPRRFEQWMEMHDRGRGRRWIPPRWLSWLAWALPGYRDRYQWNRLPCGCDIEMLRYRWQDCYACNGSGYRYLPVSEREAAIALEMHLYKVRSPGYSVVPPMS